VSRRGQTARPSLQLHHYSVFASRGNLWCKTNTTSHILRYDEWAELCLMFQTNWGKVRFYDSETSSTNIFLPTWPISRLLIWRDDSELNKATQCLLNLSLYGSARSGFESTWCCPNRSTNPRRRYGHPRISPFWHWRFSSHPSPGSHPP